VSRNVNCFCDPNISGQLNHLNFWEWRSFAVIFGGEWGGRVCTRCVGLQANAEKTRIYSLLHVAKNSYPQDVS
jgi:hypothetical protein